jgi:hypothetical protein
LTGVTLPASSVIGPIAGSQLAPASVTGTQLASSLALGGTTTGVFVGDGSGLTGVTVPASAVTGPIAGSQLAPASVTGTQLASNLALGGTTTGIFVGNGSGLTGVTVPASSVTGTIPGSQLAAASVTGSQLASNITLSGDTTIANEISLAPTDSTGTDGVLNIGGIPFLSAFGMDNTFVGGAGNFSVSGSSNTAIGYQALFSNTTGAFNTAAGFEAGANLTTGNNNIDIGDFNPATLVADDVAGESNTIRLGEVSTQTATYVAGIYGAASTSSSATLVYVDPTGHLTTSSTVPLVLPAGSITSADLGVGIVTGAQLASNLTLAGTTSGTFIGNGSGLTGITVPASSVTGTIPGSQLAAASVTGAQLASNLTLGGTTSGIFSGNGSGLTGITVPASSVTGTIPGSQLAPASVTGAQLASNLTLGGTTSGAFSGNGSGLTGVGVAAVASNIAAGATAAGNLTVTGTLLSDQYGPQSFSLSTKVPGSASFPITTFRPGTANTGLAFDLMPNGAAVENQYAGFAWEDVCDADDMADVTGTSVPLHTARVGIRSSFAEFGSYSFGGAAARNLELSIGGYPGLEVLASSTNVEIPHELGIGVAPIFPFQVYSGTGGGIFTDDAGAGSTPRIGTWNSSFASNPNLTFLASQYTFQGNSGAPTFLTLSTAGHSMSGSLTLTGGTSNTALTINCASNLPPLYVHDVNNNVITRITSSGVMYLRPNSSTDTVAINPQGQSYFNGGSLGVGNNAPAYTLDVTGSARFSTSVTTPALIGAGATPSLVTGPGIGASGSATIVGTNITGVIRLYAGTAPSPSAVIATLTFANSFSYPNQSTPVIWPANAAASSLGVLPYVTGTTNGFSINAGTAGLTAGTTYQYNYFAPGY